MSIGKKIAQKDEAVKGGAIASYNESSTVRHITLAMAALAYLTAIRAQEAEKGEVRTTEKDSYR
ncbi:hypothetical protein BGM19_00340 [Streptomyces agglomeratus]|uniref:hypothetical protein n=1 Tax=Streptomyces agglomeratus TaxID=285458 RepID=UPI0008528A4F|nr:hypothetical protein [Streptomyces agglomeratus]OEJ56737.1 hypothetical protein BGM19_00340 [Streptomyces agglomeratus]